MPFHLDSSDLLPWSRGEDFISYLPRTIISPDDAKFRWPFTIRMFLDEYLEEGSRNQGLWFSLGFDGSGFYPQVDFDGLSTDPEGELCGTLTFGSYSFAYSFTYKEFPGDDPIDVSSSGSGSRSFAFTDTPGSYSVDLVETNSGDLPFPPPAPPFSVGVSPSSIDLTFYEEVRYEGSPNARSVGSYNYGDPITTARLGTWANSWAAGSQEFLEATYQSRFVLTIALSSGIEFLASPSGDSGTAAAMMTQTEAGQHAAVAAAATMAYSDLGDEVDGYRPYDREFFATQRLTTRQNAPVVYDEGVEAARGFGVYGVEDSSIILTNEITELQWRDHHGTFDPFTDSAWEQGWRAAASYQDVATACCVEGSCGRLCIVTATGASYRVTAEVGIAETSAPFAWNAWQSTVVTLGPLAPGYVTFPELWDSFPLEGDPPLRSPFLYVSEVRIVKIEIQGQDESWRVIADGYSACYPLLGSSPGARVQLLVSSQIRLGTRWGFPAFDGSGVYYRNKSLRRYARTVSAEAP